MQDIVRFKKLKDGFETLPERDRILFLSKYRPHIPKGTAQQHGKILFNLLYDPRHSEQIEESLKGRFQHDKRVRQN